MKNVRLIKILIVAVFLLFISPAMVCAENIKGETKSMYEKLKTLKPGINTEKDVLALLGKPKEKVKNEDGSITFVYSSTEYMYPHEVTFKKGKILLVAATPDKKETLKSYQKKLGKPEKVAFTYYDADFKVYIYAKSGITIVADSRGLVRELNLFVPMKLKEYLKQPFGAKWPLVYPYKQ